MLNYFSKPESNKYSMSNGRICFENVEALIPLHHENKINPNVI